MVTGSDEAYPADDEYGIDEIEDYDEIGYGDRMILFTDSDENVLYAIWVDGSVWGRNDTVYDEVVTLYAAIEWDASYVAPTAYQAAMNALSEYDDVADITDAADLEAAEKAVTEAKKITKADVTAQKWDLLQAAIADTEAAIRDYEANDTLNKTRVEVQAAYDAIIDETAAKWPAGAAEAAKAAVAAKLADMKQNELDALTPAKGDSIWNDVIVPVVQEMQGDAAKADLTAAVKKAVEGVTSVNAATGDAATVRNAIASAAQIAGNAAGATAGDATNNYDYSVDLGDSYTAIGKGSVDTITCTLTVTGSTINDIVVTLDVTVEVNA